MAHEREYVCRIVCDTSLNGNTLNKFKQKLPYELDFKEDYSIGLSSISLPNSLLNIREDVVINLAFFKKTKDSDNGQILTVHKGAPYTLISSFSVKIQKGVYLTHKQFTDSVLKNYSETEYPKKLPTPSIFTFNLYNGLSELEINDLEFIKQHAIDKINLFIGGSLKTRVTFEQLKDLFKRQVLQDLLDLKTTNLSAAKQRVYKELVYGENSNLFWDQILDIKNKLISPLFDVWTAEAKSILFANFTRNRRGAIKKFDGVNVLEKVITFFLDEVWLALCWNDDSRPSKVVFEEYGETKMPRKAFIILQNNLLNIINIYFNDLKLILNYIHKINNESDLSIEKFLKTNKELYMYNLLVNDTIQKRKKQILTELTYFLNRLYYDKSRFKIVFAPISPNYKKIKSGEKIDSDIIMLNSNSIDVGLFLGDDNFIINKLEHICNFQPRICTDTEIFIYLKNITEQYVNAQLLPLFHVLHSAGELVYGQILQQRYPAPLFLKLNNKYLRELEFEFRTRDGRLAMFDHSSDTISMVLILRPTSRGCT